MVQYHHRFFAQWLLLLPLFASSQMHFDTRDEFERYAPCYVCCASSDSSCQEEVTNTNAVIPLPAYVGIPMASCDQIRIAGEVLMAVPPMGCLMLADPAFKSACGCAPKATPITKDEESIAEDSIESIPSPGTTRAIIPSEFPTKEPKSNSKRNGTDMKSSVSDFPSSVPSDTPSATPSATPPSNESSKDKSTGGARSSRKDPTAMPSDMPSLVPAEYNAFASKEERTSFFSPDSIISSSDFPSMVPSDQPSMVPSDQPSLAPSPGLRQKRGGMSRRLRFI